MAGRVHSDEPNPKSVALLAASGEEHRFGRREALGIVLNAARNRRQVVSVEVEIHVRGSTALTLIRKRGDHQPKNA